ncbi:MAG: sulfotransferase family protein [Bacteroidota bacterium]
MNWTDCRKEIEARNAPFHPNAPANDFHNSLLISPKHEYVFANNPKVACSTIRKLLIDAEFGVVKPYAERASTLYFKEFLPFLNVWQIGNFAEWINTEGLYKFCFVRHPYTRLLSGYLDKVVRSKHEKNNILEAMGKADQPDLDISFDSFVRVVCDMPIIKQDHHWRVQYYQTFQAGINYSFVGRFEQLEADLRTVAEQIGISQFITPETFGQAGQNSRQHATNAGGLIRQYYTPALKRLVQQCFEKDFEYFGYGE